MEIEVVTTKRKLNKHIIKQMRELEPDEICDDVEVIGFVNNVDAQTPRLIIVQLQRFDYRIVHWNWRLGTDKLYRNLRKGWVCQKTFKSEADAKKYYDALQDYKQFAEQVYM